LQMIDNPSLDPLQMSQLSSEDLIALTDANEDAAARHSLDAELRHWQDGRPILARDWIKEIYQEVWYMAKQMGFSCFLSPLQKILREGNAAEQWLNLQEQGLDTHSVMVAAIQGLADQEQELEDKLCQGLVV